jgi:hypothetical protein
MVMNEYGSYHKALMRLDKGLQEFRGYHPNSLRNKIHEGAK